VHRDPRYFSPRPEDFWPERWLPSAPRGEDFRLDMRAYTPFNFGPGACVGRSLALHEARAVLRALVRRFDLTFAPGFDVSGYEGRLRDKYALVRTELMVVVTPRK
jgi:cytochrome P450